MDPFISMIMGWGPVWAPRNWALCQNQLMAISTNTALFSLIGTLYGGDGRTTFALPDLRGRVPVGTGNGPGLTPTIAGQKGGLEYVTLNSLEIPQHTHSFSAANLTVTVRPPAVTTDGTTNTPGPTVKMAKGQVPAGLGSNPSNIYSDAAADTELAAYSAQVGGNGSIGYTGGSQSHENRMPFAVISWVIALYGIFPSRN